MIQHGSVVVYALAVHWGGPGSIPGAGYPDLGFSWFPRSLQANAGIVPIQKGHDPLPSCS